MLKGIFEGFNEKREEMGDNVRQNSRRYQFEEENKNPELVRESPFLPLFCLPNPSDFADKL
jgi:hypothetical protein